MKKSSLNLEDSPLLAAGFFNKTAQKFERQEHFPDHLGLIILPI
jgi:hypothetical protein